MTKTIFLSLRATHLTASLNKDGKWMREVKFTTMAELVDLIEKFEPDAVTSSSSLDFPREYTTDKALIALCDEIRS